MMMDRALHQKPASAGRVAVRRGEAPSGAASDEARSPRHDPEDAGRDLLWQVLARGNMERAWKRVKTNKGAAGVDGLDIGQTKGHLKHAWPSIRHQLTEGTYRPMPVRRVCIPKPDGSERELGIRAGRWAGSGSGLNRGLGKRQAASKGVGRPRNGK